MEKTTVFETVFVDSNGLLLHEHETSTRDGDFNSLKHGDISVLAGEDDLDEEELDAMIRAYEKMK